MLHDLARGAANLAAIWLLMPGSVAGTVTRFYLRDKAAESG